jgi:hypothetical protein
MAKRSITFLIVASLFGTSCFWGRGGGFRLFEAAVVTAAIVSAVQPPPPQVVFVPAPREGYVWQQGYWTRQGDAWVWMDGGWIEQRPHYQWMPTHWEQQGDGSWRLVQGQWVPG